MTLPPIMVAPNGARRRRSDHPALPETIPQTVETARACFAAGAGAIHAHVRDGEGRHVLDAGLYRELMAELAREVPGMLVQITTEAVGRYTPSEQRALVAAVRPKAVSVALREMLAEGVTPEVRGFYRDMAGAGVMVQHILYAPEELDRLGALIAAGELPGGAVQLLFVLGDYAMQGGSDPAQLDPFRAALARFPVAADWAVCAFGRGETACMAEAFRHGGKARVGFENNLLNADGSVAADNAERVREVAALPGCPAGRAAVTG